MATDQRYDAAQRLEAVSLVVVVQPVRNKMRVIKYFSCGENNEEKTKD